MSQIYYYTKKLKDSVLIEAIQLRTSIRKEFLNCNYFLDSNGEVPQNNIALSFSRALTSLEQDELTVIINAMGNYSEQAPYGTYDLEIRKHIEETTMTWAEMKGKEIMRQFASHNIFRGKTDDQVDALSTQYPDILHTLSTGSLKAAYRVFSSMTPDANISQEEIDEFKLRIMITLGL